MTANPTEIGPRQPVGSQLPDDPALPALAALREQGLAAIPTLGMDGRPARLSLCGYSPGDRATVEARVWGPGGGHFAIKAYTSDPAPEAELYQAFAGAGLTAGSGLRVPPLLAWDGNLKVLVMGWLEGRPLNEVIKDGQPERAGELASQWFRLAASLPFRLGPPSGAARVLKEAGPFAAMLETGDAALGPTGRALIESLARAQPPEHTPRLVHGTLYVRQFLDRGGDRGPGIIDWQRFGVGPLELDAGTFLATLWRRALLRPRYAAEASRVEATFRAGTAGLLDERALAWHQAAALLRLAGRMLRRRPAAQAISLLARAAELAEASR